MIDNYDEYDAATDTATDAMTDSMEFIEGDAELNDFTDEDDDYGDKGLIETEQLQVFDVVDSFCNICGDLTPHHIDDPKSYVREEELAPDVVIQAARPETECVYCRENEENEIKGL